jgi:hypothetical protein
MREIKGQHDRRGKRPDEESPYRGNGDVIGNSLRNSESEEEEIN